MIDVALSDIMTSTGFSKVVNYSLPGSDSDTED